MAWQKFSFGLSPIGMKIAGAWRTDAEGLRERGACGSMGRVCGRCELTAAGKGLNAMSDTVRELTSDTFDAATAAGLSVVDFWAPWCGPCRAMAPVFDAVAGEYADRASFFKVNVDEQPALAARFGVQSIPTLVLLRGGQPVDSLLGLQKPEALAAAIRRQL